MKLCEHVEWAERPDGVEVTRGTATPLYGWSKEQEADVPLLRCSDCRATVPLIGTPVFLRPQPARNRAEPEGFDLI